MFTVTLDDGKKIMYTGQEDGPRVDIGNVFEPVWIHENHGRKLGGVRKLTEEEVSEDRFSSQLANIAALHPSELQASQFAFASLLASSSQP